MAVSVVTYGLIRFNAPIAEAIFLDIFSICIDQFKCLSMYTPNDLTESTFSTSQSLISIVILLLTIVILSQIY